MTQNNNMTIANPAMAPRGGGDMAGLPPPLDPPLRTCMNLEDISENDHHKNTWLPRHACT